MSEIKTDIADMPNTAIVAAAHARTLIERRRYEEARKRVSEALNTHPEDEDLLFLSAYIDYLTDDNDAARQTVQSLLQISPQHAGGRDLYAHLLEDGKQYADAERLRIELLRDFPEEPDFYASYASLMLRTFNLDKARRLAAEGLRHDPEHPGCLFAMTLVDFIASGGKQHSANLEALVQQHPESARTIIALVIALQERGDHKGALRISQELLRAYPDSPHYLEMVRELKLQTHWSMKLMYPMQRWGWGGAVALWIGGIVGLRAIQPHVSKSTHLVISLVWLAYVIYTWVWPRILRKLI